MEDPLEAEVRLASPRAEERARLDDEAVVQAQTLLGQEVDQDSLPIEVQALISRCMEGTEPLSRELKHNEARKLSAQHIVWIGLRAAGWRVREIARVTGFDTYTIHLLLRHPYARKLLDALVHRNTVRVLDIRTRLEEYTAELVDHVFGLAMAEEDTETVAKVTFGFLDRAGFGPTSKTVSEETKNVNLRATASASGLARLASALEGSQVVSREVMASWRPAPPPDVGGGESVGLSEEGLGTSSRGEGAPAQPSPQPQPRPQAQAPAPAPAKTEVA